MFKENLPKGGSQVAFGRPPCIAKQGLLGIVGPNSLRKAMQGSRMKQVTKSHFAANNTHTFPSIRFINLSTTNNPLSHAGI